MSSTPQYPPVTHNPHSGMALVRPAMHWNPKDVRSRFCRGVWKFNPWTGRARLKEVIETDPFGDNLCPPHVQPAKPKLIYLASPYSHTDPEVVQKRYEQACAAAGEMMRDGGNIVFAPIAHSHDIGRILGNQVGGYANETAHAFWMKQDLEILRRCDELHVLMLDGWEYSRGVKEEVAFARANGIPVKHRKHADRGPLYAPLNAPAAPPEAADSKDTNPKDGIGATKLPLSLVPATAIALASLAHLDGALKYGKWNWRIAGVRASIYVDAARRHLDKWFNGEDLDPDSGLPHFAHALACINILVDADAAGKLTDDRPPSVDISKAYEALTPLVDALKTKHAGRGPKHYTIADSEAS